MGSEDLSGVYDLVQELSRRLLEQQRHAQSLKMQVSTFQKQISSNAMQSLRGLQGAVTADSLDSALLRENERLSRDVVRYRHEIAHLSARIDDYEHALQTIMAKVRTYAHEIQSGALYSAREFVEQLVAQNDEARKLQAQAIDAEQRSIAATRIVRHALARTSELEAQDDAYVARLEAENHALRAALRLSQGELE